MSKKAVWYKITTEKSILVEIDSEAQAEIIAELNQDTERNEKNNKRNNRRIISLEHIHDDLGINLDDGSLPLLEMIEKEKEQITLSEKLDYAMSKLTPKQYKVIYLHFYMGLNQSTIAKVLGIDKGNVSYTLRRALHKMRKFYE